jgi:L-methionine (R)-S-oxide reductase
VALHGICTFAAMAESLHIPPNANKASIYLSLLPQLKALIDPAAQATANVGNLMAALKQTFDWWWIGVYYVRDNHLELGPFQGPIACTRIAMGKGVCGVAWEQKRTIVVPDVDAFPGHIACSALSKSEIVVPILSGEQVLGVLDADSEYLAHFDSVDQDFLEQIVVLIASCHA